MNKLVSSIVIALGVSATSAAMAAGDPAKGKTLAATCGACHGGDGNSAMANYPKLAGIGEKYLLKQMKDIKSGARAVPEMAGQLDRLSEQDMADVAAYFDSKTTQLSGSKDIKVLVNSGEQVSALELGTKLYRAGDKEAGIPACTGCHSPRGQGNEPAGYPRLSGQHAAYIEKQLKNFRDGKRTNDAAKTMRSIAERMSDAEIKAVANLVAGLN